MFTSGFFNSMNGDRKYNAEQVSAIMDGLISDGIFDSIGDHFAVTPGTGMSVNVGTGRAWLNSTWSYNDSPYAIELTASSPSLGRIDLICIKVDHSTQVRQNSIVKIEGTPGSSPVEPTVTDDTTNGVYYHKLAAVSVAAGATSITAADITNYIGLAAGTPYVTGILETTTVDELWSQWDGEFNAWWEDIKNTLDEDVVTTILNKIDHITPKEATMQKYGFSHQNPPPSGKVYKEYSTDAILDELKTLADGAFYSEDYENQRLSAVYKLWSVQDVQSFSTNGQTGGYIDGAFTRVAIDGGHTLVALAKPSGIFTFNTQTGECLARSFPAPSGTYVGVEWTDIIYAQNKFIAVGRYSYANGNNYAYVFISATSADGIAWTLKTYSDSSTGAQNSQANMPKICYDSVGGYFYTIGVNASANRSYTNIYKSGDPYDLCKSSVRVNLTGSNFYVFARWLAVGENGEVYVVIDTSAQAGTSWNTFLYGSADGGTSWNLVHSGYYSRSSAQINCSRYKLTNQTNAYGGYPFFYDSYDKYNDTACDKVRVLDGMSLKATDFTFTGGSYNQYPMSITANGKTVIACNMMGSASLVPAWIVFNARDISEYEIIPCEWRLGPSSANMEATPIAPANDGYGYGYKLAVNLKKYVSKKITGKDGSNGDLISIANGTYIGTGTSRVSTSINLVGIFFVDVGFTPKYVMVTPNTNGGSACTSTATAYSIGAVGVDQYSGGVIIAENGFIVVPGCIMSNTNYNYFNNQNIVYSYLAIGTKEEEVQS